MFSKALRPARALPLRSAQVPPLRNNAFVAISKRAVTTDAASSHAEKEDVPAVSCFTGSKMATALPVERC